MPKVEIDGLDNLLLSFRELAQIPDEVVDDMLNAQADIAAAAQQEEAKKMLVGDYVTGTTALSIKKGKIKLKNGQRVLYVTPTGTRKRGKRKISKTRNAEIAFINEYGDPGHRIPARPFIRTANERTAPDIENASDQTGQHYVFEFEAIGGVGYA